MGTDWLKDQIENIRTTERMHQQQNEKQLRRANAIKAKAHTFLADASKETKKAVDTLNLEFKDDQKRQLTVETRPNAIAVMGLGSQVTATLQPGGIVRFTTQSGHAHVHTAPGWLLYLCMANYEMLRDLAIRHPQARLGLPGRRKVWPICLWPRYLRFVYPTHFGTWPE